MNVYIVTENPSMPIGNEDLRIIQVRPEDDVAFQQQYAGHILITGSSIQDVLIKFGQHINSH